MPLQRHAIGVKGIGPRTPLFVVGITVAVAVAFTVFGIDGDEDQSGVGARGYAVGVGVRYHRTVIDLVQAAGNEVLLAVGVDGRDSVQFMGRFASRRQRAQLPVYRLATDGVGADRSRSMRWIRPPSKLRGPGTSLRTCRWSEDSYSTLLWIRLADPRDRLETTTLKFVFQIAQRGLTRGFRFSHNPPEFHQKGSSHGGSGKTESNREWK